MLVVFSESKDLVESGSVVWLRTLASWSGWVISGVQPVILIQFMLGKVTVAAQILSNESTEENLREIS